MYVLLLLLLLLSLLRFKYAYLKRNKPYNNTSVYIV